MRKLNVDENSCIGCGACISLDPEHFDFNDEGLSSVINEDNIDSEELKTALESCPTGAISISDCDCKENCNCGDECNCNEECDCCK